MVGLALHNVAMAQLYDLGVRGNALDAVAAWKEALLLLALSSSHGRFDTSPVRAADPRPTTPIVIVVSGRSHNSPRRRSDGARRSSRCVTTCSRSPPMAREVVGSRGKSEGASSGPHALSAVVRRRLPRRPAVISLQACRDSGVAGWFGDQWVSTTRASPASRRTGLQPATRQPEPQAVRRSLAAPSGYASRRAPLRRQPPVPLVVGAPCAVPLCRLALHAHTRGARGPRLRPRRARARAAPTRARGTRGGSGRRRRSLPRRLPVDRAVDELHARRARMASRERSRRAERSDPFPTEDSRQIATAQPARRCSLVFEHPQGYGLGPGVVAKRTGVEILPRFDDPSRLRCGHRRLAAFVLWSPPCSSALRRRHARRSGRDGAPACAPDRPIGITGSRRRLALCRPRPGVPRMSSRDRQRLGSRVT